MNHQIAIQILEESKKHLWNGEGVCPIRFSPSIGVCMATAWAARALGQEQEGKRLRWWIWQSMGEQGDLGVWLKDRGHVLTKQELQQHRLTWIDYLIGVLK